MNRRLSANDPLQPTILDRLLAGTGEVSCSIEGLKESVRRDLQALLNTRWYSRELPQDALIEESILNYGVPDFSGEDLSATEERTQLCLKLKQAIERYEPRLKNVQVTPVIDEGSPTDRISRTMRVRIEAILSVASMRQEIVFDSDLDPSMAILDIPGGSGD